MGNNLIDKNLIIRRKGSKKLDYIEAIKEIKILGEQLGYTQEHYLNVIERLMKMEDNEGFEIYEDLKDPQEIVDRIIHIHYTPKTINETEMKLKNFERPQGENIHTTYTRLKILQEKHYKSIKCKKKKRNINRERNRRQYPKPMHNKNKRKK